MLWSYPGLYGKLQHVCDSSVDYLNLSYSISSCSTLYT